MPVDPPLPDAKKPERKKIAYFVTEDWYFCSHRLQLAVAAKNAGYEVYVITRVQAHGDEIIAAGLNLVPIELSRRSKNPFTELGVIRRLTKIYKEIQPDIVHHVAIKPVIYGSVAAWRAEVVSVVNAMAGLGFLFISERVTARVLRPVIRLMFSLLLNNHRTTVILQNPDDVEVLCGSGAVGRNRVELIRGSGVDTQVYRYTPEPDGVPVVLLASRMLWDKGVGEFVEAARAIKERGIAARFALAGDGDAENPASIDASQLQQWSDEGIVECWGRRSNMHEVFSGVHIVCLPSYREGVPKVLIEAASCGRPIVATDVPGCREIVIDGRNGRLVPGKDAGALAEAIAELLQSKDQRRDMGRTGRQMVKDHFSIGEVIARTLDVYEGTQR